MNKALDEERVGDIAAAADPAADTVFIEGLEIDALIGIYDWERRIRQPLRLDLEMDFDNRRPAASDDIADTLDYKAVSKRLIELVSGSDCGLVETLAERCAEVVLREFAVSRVRLRLAKPGAVRGAAAVGVRIERRRAGLPDVAAPGAPAAAKGEAGHQATERNAPVAAPEPASPPEPEPDPKREPGRESAPAFARRSAGAPQEPPVAGSRAASTPAPTVHEPFLRDAPRPLVAPRDTAATMPRGGRLRGGQVRVFVSLGSNIEPERNLQQAVRALRARFGEVRVSPVYRTAAVGFRGPDFLNAIAAFDCGIHPFALNHWLHAQEIAQGRDRRDKSYSDRTLDMDIIYFGDLVLDGPGEFQLPRAELHHAFVLKPLVDIAPDFVDPVRHSTLSKIWAAHPQHDAPPERVELEL